MSWLRKIGTIGLLVSFATSGCAAPVLIAEPEPEARIGVVSLLHDHPGHFVDSLRGDATGFRATASITNFGDRYLAASVMQLEGRGFNVSLISAPQALIDRRTTLFQGEKRARETVAELKKAAGHWDIDYAVVLFPKVRTMSRRRTDVVFVEGYGMFSFCQERWCRNRTVNSVSVAIVDFENELWLEARDFDYLVWGEMPEELIWVSIDDIKTLSADYIDQAASLALEDFQALYLNLLRRGQFLR